MVRHDADWIYLTKDLGLPIPLREYDNLSRRRISRLIEIRGKQLEAENELKKQQMKEAEKRARVQARTAQKGGGPQRIPLP